MEFGHKKRVKDENLYGLPIRPAVFGYQLRRTISNCSEANPEACKIFRTKLTSIGNENNAFAIINPLDSNKSWKSY